jgi:hypothetical protein
MQRSVIKVVVVVVIIIMSPPFNVSTEGTFAVTTDREKQLVWALIAVHALTQPYVDRITSNVCLTWGGLLFEMEGFMCAIQDQVVSSRNYRNLL